nr:hypothetical protein [Tanacetum cinerariifolium]
MSLEESNDLNLPDAEPVNPILEASSIPKFDMHMYKSSLNETNVKWLTKCYGIPADLHPRLASKEDLRPKTGDMVTTKLPCRKVLDDKEKKKRKDEAKAAVDAPGADTQVEKVVRDKGADKEENDAAIANEGHSDNESGIFGLQTQPSPSRPVDHLLETVEKHVLDKVISLDALVIYPSLPNEQANTLLCFDALTEEHANLVYAHESCKDVKARYKECRKELEKAYLQDRLEELEEEKKETKQLNSAQADRIKQLEEALKQSEADAHQLRLHKERLSLAIGKGFIDGISIGHKDPDVQAILKATPNVNPTSADIFMETYKKLFDKRYAYVEKVARMYLLDPSGLYNVMPDEIGPTPGEGSRDTPTASFA